MGTQYHLNSEQHWKKEELRDRDLNKYAFVIDKYVYVAIYIHMMTTISLNFD